MGRENPVAEAPQLLCMSQALLGRLLAGTRGEAATVIACDEYVSSLRSLGGL